MSKPFSKKCLDSYTPKIHNQSKVVFIHCLQQLPNALSIVCVCVGVTELVCY